MYIMEHIIGTLILFCFCVI